MTEKQEEFAQAMGMVLAAVVVQLTVGSSAE
jgi:hypothetical protein